MNQENIPQQNGCGCSGCQGCGGWWGCGGLGCGCILVLVLAVLMAVAMIFGFGFPTKIIEIKTSSPFIEKVSKSFVLMMKGNLFIPAELAYPIYIQKTSNYVLGDEQKTEANATLRILEVTNVAGLQAYLKKLEENAVPGVTLTKLTQFKTWRELPRATAFVQIYPLAEEYMKEATSGWTVKWETKNDAGDVQKWMGYMFVSPDSKYVYLDYSEEDKVLQLFPEMLF